MRLMGKSKNEAAEHAESIEAVWAAPAAGVYQRSEYVMLRGLMLELAHKVNRHDLGQPALATTERPATRLVIRPGDFPLFEFTGGGATPVGSDIISEWGMSGLFTAIGGPMNPGDGPFHVAGASDDEIYYRLCATEYIFKCTYEKRGERMNEGLASITITPVLSAWPPSPRQRLAKTSD